MSAFANVKRYFKGLDRRRRAVWITAACLVVLSIAGAVTAAVLLTRRGEGESVLPSGTGAYSYAIAPGDATGYYIDASFTGGIAPDQFDIVTVKQAEGVTLSPDFRLSAPDAASGAKAEYSILYDGAVKARVIVSVKQPDGIVSDVAALAGLNGKSGVYFLGDDIDVSPLTSGIAKFSGELYGNHHTLYNLKLATGVFSRLEIAVVNGVNVTSDVSASVSGGGSYGALAAEAVSSDIAYCSVNGTFSLSVDVGRDKAVAVGGIAGYVTAGVRNSPDSVTKKISFCSVGADITLVSAGQVRFGAIAGVVTNAAVYDSVFGGKMTFYGAADKMSALYAGGIAGIADKNYGSATPSGGALEESSRLCSKGVIDIDVQGDTDLFAVNAGGIYGRTQGLSLNNPEFGGSLDIAAAGLKIYVGGVTGAAVNENALKMSIRGIRVTGEIKAYTLRTAYAGGIAGFFREGDAIEYSSVYASVKPVIETDEASVTAVQKSSEAVGNR